MTKIEFSQVMAYIATAVQKPITPGLAEVYFDLLSDLPVSVFQLAAKRVLLEHPWATLPTVAELRAAAAEIMRGEVKELSSEEAWGLAWDAIGKIDPDIEGSTDRALQKVPPLVREAIQTFGIRALCYGKEPIGVIRAQFIRFYEQIAARERRTNLLPAAIKQQIEDMPEKGIVPLPAVQEMTQRIGQISG